MQKLKKFSSNSRMKRMVFSLLLGSMLAVTGLVMSPQQAMAAETADWLPLQGTYNNAVRCTWNNGCAGGYHGAGSPAIDFAVPYGTPVYAAGPGTVVDSDNSCAPATPNASCADGRGRFVQINHPDGRNSRYLHLSYVVRGSGDVSRGELIGYTGNSGDSDGTHLHYDERIGTTKVDPGSMVAVHGSSLVSYPAVLGVSSWNEVSTSGGHQIRNDTYTTPPASSNLRIGAIASGGDLIVKEGSLAAPWSTQYNSVKSFQLWGDRIGWLTTTGSLFVKAGGLGAPWVNLYPSGVTSFQLEGNRVGALLSNGDLLVKEGALDSAWSTQYNNVASFKLSGDRIGIVSTNGDVRVKAGGLGAPWVYQYGGVDQLQLSSNRIGVRTISGDVLVKEGELSAAWVNEYSNVKSFQLWANRIGVLTTANDLLVKEGALSAPWVGEVWGSANKFQLYGSRIGVLLTNGDFVVKEGALDTAWSTQFANVTAFQLAAGNRIGWLTANGGYYVKEGGLGAPWVFEYPGVLMMGLSS